jgi:hypothetical protein
MQQRMKDLNCVDVSPTGTSTSSPEHQPSSGLPSATPTPTPTPSPASGTLGPVFGDDSSSYCSDGSQGGGSSTAPPHHRGRSKLNRAKKLFRHGRSKAEDHGALSDSECQPTSWREQYLKDANSNHTKVCVMMVSLGSTVYTDVQISLSNYKVYCLRYDDNTQGQM